MSEFENPNGITIKEVVELTMRVDALLKLAEKHEKTIYGNGNEEKSVLYRLAQLEQAEKRRIESEQQQGKDARSIVMPILTQGLSVAIAALIFVVAGHVLGILH